MVSFTMWESNLWPLRTLQKQSAKLKTFVIELILIFFLIIQDLIIKKIKSLVVLPSIIDVKIIVFVIIIILLLSINK